MPTLKHPLALGLSVLSYNGECDYDDDEDKERVTGKNAVGTIVSVDHYPAQGWAYGVSFGGSGVSVTIDQQDHGGGIDDSDQYCVFDAATLVKQMDEAIGFLASIQAEELDGSEPALSVFMAEVEMAIESGIVPAKLNKPTL